MKWYEAILIIILCVGAVYLVLAPWLSIMDIHKSIDKLNDTVKEQNKLIEKLLGKE